MMPKDSINFAEQEYLDKLGTLLIHVLSCQKVETDLKKYVCSCQKNMMKGPKKLFVMNGTVFSEGEIENCSNLLQTTPSGNSWRSSQLLCQLKFCLDRISQLTSHKQSCL